MSVTTPTTVARTSQRRQMAITSSRSSGVTIASIRSWLSEVMTSKGSMPGSRRGTAATSTSMPMPARLAVSLVAQRQPGAAEVLDADDQPGVQQREAGLDQALLLERITDLHARALGLVGALAEARRWPARSPRRCRRARCWTRAARRGCPRRSPGRARAGRSAARRGTARSRAGCRGRSRRTRPHRRRSARRRRCRSRRCRDTTPSAIQRLRASSSGPKRSGSMRAIGRAPIVKMSRRMPPTPVAAP